VAVCGSAAAATLATPSPACAQFTVTPVTVVFDKGAKTGVITVANDGSGKLHLQMKAFEWTQDQAGKDRYVETDDILFFPKLMIVNSKEQRLLRVGLKTAPGSTEKTYRLFLQEIPEASQDLSGTQIQVAIRFGVPIFVKPEIQKLDARMEALALDKGELKVTVRNDGNIHFVIQSVLVKAYDAAQTELFSKELTGWYVLAGNERSYATPIPAEICGSAARLSVAVKTNQASLDDAVNVDKTRCLP
jgi:fimbrial chaperone protein